MRLRRFGVIAVLLGLLAGHSAALSETAGRPDRPVGDETSGSADVPDPFHYEAAIRVEGDAADLEDALVTASVLLTQQDNPPSGLAGLLARARQDKATLTAVLYEQAHYAAEIDIVIDGAPVESVGPFDPIAAPVAVNILVRPGGAYRFGVVIIRDAPSGFPVAATGLVAGEPAGSDTIIAAENAIADAWRERGHPLVRVEPREVVADHRTATLDVSLIVIPGPVAEFGRVAVEGAEDVDPQLIEARADIGSGPYSPERRQRAERRLRDLGVFASVRVQTADELDPDGTIPVIIRVSERKHRVIGVGASYSNVEGFEVGAYWIHRNIFGGAEELRLSVGASRVGNSAFDTPDLSVAARFRKPAAFGPMTDATLRLEAYRETTESYRKTAAAAEAGISHIFSDVKTGEISLELERSRTTDGFGVDDDHLVASLVGSLVLDKRDNALEPTSGYRTKFTAGPSYDALNHQAFAVARADAATYRALDSDGRGVFAARGALGTLLADDVTDVPVDRRLYAGGGGSVRGYAYRNIGPRTATGILVGGRSVVEGTGELRFQVNDRYGLAGFVDAASVGPDMFPSFDDVKVGVGGGVRIATPIGPIRLDVAVPLSPEKDDPDFAVYVGRGQAF